MKIDHYESTIDTIEDDVNRSDIIQETQHDLNELFHDYEKNTKLTSYINTLQTALDIIGFEPTVGSLADGANVIISTLRASLSKEKDEKKQHLINAGISAVSLIPFADVIKVLKLRKAPLLAKGAIKGARYTKNYAKKKKIEGSRFYTGSDVNGEERLAA